jgi:hypothetical protein
MRQHGKGDNIRQSVTQYAINQRKPALMKTNRKKHS